MYKSLPTRLQSFIPALIVMAFAALLLAVRAHADTANRFTSCIKSSGQHMLYNNALGTSPSAPCTSGDTQVSADYGDVTYVAQLAQQRRKAPQLQLRDDAVLLPNIEQRAIANGHRR